MFHELVCLTINDTSRSFALALLICLGAALFPHCVLFDIAAKIAKKIHYLNQMEQKQREKMFNNKIIICLIDGNLLFIGDEYGFMGNQ